MLSSVLRSDRAALVNIAIMRTCVRLRQILATRGTRRQLQEMEKKSTSSFKVVEPPPDPPKDPIGFVVRKK